jgi:glycosyltransferase involved in cell wall biosynthesis
MTTPWLSVLIPVYNAGAYLRACVESVLTQAPADTTAGIEIVLLDDASTDGSADLLQALIDEHPGRLTVLHQARNSGIAAARNRLLQAGQGRYFWFIDADDVMLPGALATLARIIRTDAPDLLLCDFQTLRARMRFKHRLRGELHRRTFTGPANRLLTDRSVLMRGLFEAGQFHLWSKIARRELWAGLQFPAGRYYEDLSVAPALALRARSAYYLPEVWIGYRQHGDSILATRTPQKIEHMTEALLWLPAELARLQPPLDEPARQAISRHVARSYVSAARYLERHAGTAAVARAYRQMLASMPLPPSAVLRHSLAHGWLWRAARLSYWLRRGAGAKP